MGGNGGRNDAVWWGRGGGKRGRAVLEEVRCIVVLAGGGGRGGVGVVLVGARGERRERETRELKGKNK